MSSYSEVEIVFLFAVFIESRGDIFSDNFSSFPTFLPAAAPNQFTNSKTKTQNSPRKIIHCRP